MQKTPISIASIWRRGTIGELGVEAQPYLGTAVMGLQKVPPAVSHILFPSQKPNKVQ